MDNPGRIPGGWRELKSSYFMRLLTWQKSFIHHLIHHKIGTAFFSGSDSFTTASERTPLKPQKPFSNFAKQLITGTKRVHKMYKLASRVFRDVQYHP